MVQKRKDGRRGDNPLAAIIGYLRGVYLTVAHTCSAHPQRATVPSAHLLRYTAPRKVSSIAPWKRGVTLFPAEAKGGQRGGHTQPASLGGHEPAAFHRSSLQGHAEAAQLPAPNGAGPKGAGVRHFLPAALAVLFFCSPAPRHTCTSHTTESRPPPRKVRIQLRWTAQAPQAATPGQPPEGESGLNRFATGSAVREIIGRLICQIEAASRQTTAAAGCRGCDQKATSCPLQGSVLGAGAALPPLFASHGAGRRRQRGRCCPSLASATECVAGAQSARKKATGVDQPAAGTLQQSAADMAEKKGPVGLDSRNDLYSRPARPAGRRERAAGHCRARSATAQSLAPRGTCKQSAHERLHPRSSLAPRQQQPRETRRVEAG
ncbi:hypothetical protein HPB48_007199 [Haemaphysalis longicornis]|uniref:Uncharacterized protein n=1 Tax=Haemaphysalis longicornis TaxID=44386 RepID=A0A9J6G2A1_HAELO|nr:hypothetical protein HPB48_007199 [Haemaphysalis longicornis]